ncbi:MAG: 4-(cytidine 5'-diphospho)-2-C-methyl-D-erythritol kinase [Bowdeniella nasicola]|nr:4-(cytidine 5'-diphospho)-2-C-methyl-D-erythritol kinase [Bowdeniella nasicola]
MRVPVTVRAPGKVNLYLAVGPKRADGFHDLATVFQAVSLYDDIKAMPAPGISLAFSGLGEDLPTDETNLAYRAARAVAQAGGIDTDSDGVALRIHKRIPIAGGMAGGSADAAGTLVACNLMWNAGLSHDTLLEIGAELGSDVPFCLTGGTAIGTGRGEKLTTAFARGTFVWVVATMKEGLSTPTVFRAFDQESGRSATPPTISQTFLQALAQGDTNMVGYAGRNDLMTAALALHRGARTVMDFFCHHSLHAMVSGSGPTLIAQVESVERGRGFARELRRMEPVDDACVLTGPVSGVEVMSGPTTEGGIPGQVGGEDSDALADRPIAPVRPLLRIVSDESNDDA